MKQILITGGSGLVGTRLSEILTEKGYAVRHLSRTVNGNEKYLTFRWDLADKFIDPKAFEGIDIIIHLAGTNVSSGRWTDAKKKEILSSRIDTMFLLKEKLQNQKLEAFISASGISYYGTETTEKIFNETDPAGTDFIAQVSVKWEAACDVFKTNTDRIIALRTGIVLSREGGALAKLKQPIKMGIGSPLGSGKQYMPWIHLEDLCLMYVAAIENTAIKGIYNAVSDQHINNAGMTKVIADVLNKKLWAPAVPAFVLKLLFGEMANIILKGSRIDNEKIKAAGFQFKYPQLKPALEDLL